MDLATFVIIIVIIFIIALLVISTIIVVGVVRTRDNPQDQAVNWEMFAMMAGLKYMPLRPFRSSAQLSGIYRGRELLIDLASPASDNDSPQPLTYTRFKLVIENPAAITLTLVGQSIAQSVTAQPAPHPQPNSPIVTGAADFDRRFNVTGEPDGVAEYILVDATLRKQLLEQPPLFEIKISKQQLVCLRHEVVSEVTALKAVCELASDVANAVDAL